MARPGSSVAEIVFRDDLEFHTLELPKFAGSADRIDQSPAMEKWLYFSQHAEHLERGELAARLGDAAYLDAVRLLAARQEGRKEGLEKGRDEGLEKGTVAGKMPLSPQILGEPEHSTETPAGRSVQELSSLLDEPQRRLLDRGI